MNRVEGVIVREIMNQGSKSEGVYTFLVIESGERYTLAREDVYEVNDNFFAPFEGQSVVVTGELLQDNWLKVENIELKVE